MRLALPATLATALILPPGLLIAWLLARRPWMATAIIPVVLTLVFATAMAIRQARDKGLYTAVHQSLPSS